MLPQSVVAVVQDDTGTNPFEIIPFDTPHDFKEWWRKPYNDTFESYWAAAQDIAEGSCGTVKRFTIQIGKKCQPFHIAVKRLTKLHVFNQNIDTFNANLAAHPNLFPSFVFPAEFKEPKTPLAPVMQLVETAACCICAMGIYRDLDDHCSVAADSPQHQCAIVAALYTLLVQCHTHNVAVPDFKLSNCGVTIAADGRVTRAVLLDIDSVIFTDTCFKGDVPNITLVCTYVGLAQPGLFRFCHATKEGGLKKGPKLQLAYLTAILFYLFMAQIALKLKTWDPHYEYGPKRTKPDKKLIPYKPGVVLARISKKAETIATEIAKKTTQNPMWTILKETYKIASNLPGSHTDHITQYTLLSNV